MKYFLDLVVSAATSVNIYYKNIFLHLLFYILYLETLVNDEAQIKKKLHLSLKFDFKLISLNLLVS